jgi:membrane-associated phospholipid phosphatase
MDVTKIDLNDITDFMNIIGRQGPIITFIITAFYLLQQKKYLLAFLVLSFINNYLNIILKLIFKIPRPHTKIANDPDLERRLKDFNEDKYGMPSYHAQTVFFPTVFLYLVNNRPFVLLLELTICFLTLHQRWYYKRHDIPQLVAGSIIGTLVAYAGYSLTNHYLRTQ